MKIRGAANVDLSIFYKCDWDGNKQERYAARDVLEISFEWSILYRPIFVMDACFLLSSCCCNATGPSILNLLATELLSAGRECSGQIHTRSRWKENAMRHEQENVRANWHLRNVARTKTLSFPNQSRFYDATRRAVRFWGHDSAMETSFYVTEDAFKRIQPDTRFDEVGTLGAFDANRDLIYAAAAKVYARGHKHSYDLVSSDF
jgi:Protein of unknown function (DUF1488)